MPAPPSELFSAACYNVHRKTGGQEDEDMMPTPAHLQALQAVEGSKSRQNEGDPSEPAKNPLSQKREVTRIETASVLAKQHNQLKAIKSRPVVSGRGGVPNLAKMGWTEPTTHSPVADVGRMTPASNQMYASSSSSSVMSFRSS
jgi:hypothetical protein